MSYEIKILSFFFFTAILAVIMSLHPLCHPLPFPCALYGQAVLTIVSFPWYLTTYRLKTCNLNNKSFIKNIFFYSYL